MDWELIGAILAAVVAGLTAFFQRRGKVEVAAKLATAEAIGTVLIKGIEKAGDPSIKGIVKTLATDAGVKDVLHSVVKKVTAAAVLCAAFVLAGCAAPAAGQATSPVTASMQTDNWSVSSPGGGALTFTISQVVTITPTSTATQTAETKVDATATVPAGGLPK